MSKSNEEISEESPCNNGIEGNSESGTKLYEFKSHFSYKCLYDKLELLQIELNDDSREITLSCNKKPNNSQNITNKGDKPSRNEGVQSRNILLNHIVCNNNDNIDDDNIALDNICIKIPNKTHQIIPRGNLNKEDSITNRNNNKEKEKENEKKKKKDECNKQTNDNNAQTRNISKNSKKVYTSSNNKQNIKKRASNVLCFNKKKPPERTAASMARPQKINCNLAKIAFKPNSRSHPPLTRRIYHCKKDVIFPFNPINTNINSKVVPPSSSSSVKANSTSKHKPSSLNINIKFNPLPQYNPKTSIHNNVSLSKPKETISLIDNKFNKRNQITWNHCSIIKENRHNPLTQIHNKHNKPLPKKKNSNNNNTALTKGMVNNAQEKQRNLNLKFGTHLGHQCNSFQLNINHQTKDIAMNKKHIEGNKGQSPNKNINPIAQSIKGGINNNNNPIGKEKCKQKQLISPNINIRINKPKNTLKQLDIIMTTKKTTANNIKKDTDGNIINSSLSRNQRSSLESLENNMNTKRQYKTKVSKEKYKEPLSQNRYEHQHQHQKIPLKQQKKRNTHQLDRNNSSGEKIFHTLDTMHFKKCNSNQKKVMHNYNTNPNAERVNNQSSINKGGIGAATGTGTATGTERKRKGNSSQKSNDLKKGNGVVLGLIKNNERHFQIKQGISKNNK